MSCDVTSRPRLGSCSRSASSSSARLVLGLLGAYQYLHPSLPDVTAIKDIRLRVPLRVYSRDGKLIAQFGEERRIPLAFDAIPNQMVNAVLAAEDDSFFQHSGVDYPGPGARDGAPPVVGRESRRRQHDHDAAHARHVPEPGEELSPQAARDLH